MQCVYQYMKNCVLQRIHISCLLSAVLSDCGCVVLALALKIILLCVCIPEGYFCMQKLIVHYHSGYNHCNTSNCGAFPILTSKLHCSLLSRVHGMI